MKEKARAVARRLKNSAEVLVSIGNVVVLLSGKITPLGLIGAATSILGILLESDNLRPTHWKQVPMVCSELLAPPVEYQNKDDPDFYDLPDQRAMHKTDLPSWYVSKSPEKFLELVRNAHWSKSSHLSLAETPKPSLVAVVPKDFSSPLEDQIWNHSIAPFLEDGSNRSILLVGPPGTGKSALAQRLAIRMGQRTLYIADLDQSISNSQQLISSIDLLAPDVVVLDDIDRVDGWKSANFLKFLEHLRSRCSLVIGTINNIMKMDQAAIRPERFDEILTVTSLGSEYMKEVLQRGGLLGPLREDPELLASVTTWPIAFVQELIRRKRCRPNFKLETEVASLQARVGPKGPSAR